MEIQLGPAQGGLYYLLLVLLVKNIQVVANAISLQSSQLLLKELLATTKSPLQILAYVVLPLGILFCALAENAFNVRQGYPDDATLIVNASKLERNVPDGGGDVVQIKYHGVHSDDCSLARALVQGRDGTVPSRSAFKETPQLATDNSTSCLLKLKPGSRPLKAPRAGLKFLPATLKSSRPSIVTSSLLGPGNLISPTLGIRSPCSNSKIPRGWEAGLSKCLTAVARTRKLSAQA
ncbi:hypothetical protein CLAIMM_14438 isoform 2 [Cladophialophora immunda]|nr:hypothetical protein CLAIMM_14438 isoform 1 [Cladophialophora immunda]OQV10443.1 hypothetical protein CLAIMM_14438 isoform 2 [Cladophialophora immunda]